MRIEVIRSIDNGVQTLGEMFVFDEKEANKFKCKTMELPFLNNIKEKSCIPKGKYICEKVPASKNIPYPHISITNVPNRAGVCIHKANYYTQLKGCIAVGENLIDINADGQKDTTNSGKTFDKIMAIMPKNFTLTIK